MSTRLRLRGRVSPEGGGGATAPAPTGGGAPPGGERPAAGGGERCYGNRCEESAVVMTTGVLF